MSSPYHEGELAVQERAGVRGSASRIGRGIRDFMSPEAMQFLRAQPMIVVGSVDSDGSVWASLVAGAPGFVEPLDERTLEIDAKLCSGKRLSRLEQGAPIAVLAIEFAARRRIRVNGRIERNSLGRLRVRTEQVYANCPKYIRRRGLRHGPDYAPEGPSLSALELGPSQRTLVEQADTFFVASAHPVAGADVSHRGGCPGFARVPDTRRIVWPDYPGNTMFQTLGNIATNPRAGLLFIDFENGTTLQLTGSARVIWDGAAVVESPGAERLVEFEVERVVESSGYAPRGWRLLADPD